MNARILIRPGLVVIVCLSIAATVNACKKKRDTDNPVSRSTETAAHAADIRSVRGPYKRIIMRGESAQLGYFDPSVEYGDDGIGWMTYSAVSGKGRIQTNIGKSTDRGRTWEQVGALNEPIPDTVPIGLLKNQKGLWRREVSSLVYDPDDTANRRWKVFTHRYFVRSNQKIVPKYGWITYQYASRPDRKWSREIALFGAGKNPPAPYTAKINLNALHPELESSFAYTEPGAMYYRGSLYLTLTGLGKSGPDTIFLFKSDDHGEHWRYLGKLLDRNDAQREGFEVFDGSSLATEGGRAFLLVSPGAAPGAKSKKDLLHNGTYVVEFTDIDRAKLKKRGNRLAVHKYLLPDNFVEWRGAGQSDYHEKNTGGGMVMPQFNWPARPKVYQLYSTQERILD